MCVSYMWFGPRDSKKVPISSGSPTATVKSSTDSIKRVVCVYIYVALFHHVF
eukprot:m.172515 g.172515  ORF g.172515 m.172515 type:complete len:52 (+) comp14835_c0_seq1:3046-3201(+)